MIYLVIPKSHVNTVQDDISAKNFSHLIASHCATKIRGLILQGNMFCNFLPGVGTEAEYFLKLSFGIYIDKVGIDGLCGSKIFKNNIKHYICALIEFTNS